MRMLALAAAAWLGLKTGSHAQGAILNHSPTVCLVAAAFIDLSLFK
jgi:hypothetical protein